MKRIAAVALVTAVAACTSFGTDAPTTTSQDGGGARSGDAAAGATPPDGSAAEAGTTPTGPALVQAAADSDSGPEFEFDLKAPPTAGNVLVFVLAVAHDHVDVVDDPDDWTRIQSSDSNVSLFVWTRVATGKETQITGGMLSFQEFEMFLTEWSGVKPFVPNSDVATDSGVSPGIGPQKLTVASPVIAIGFAGSPTNQTTSPAAPYTIIGADAHEDDVSLLGAYQVNPPTGQTAPSWMLIGDTPGWDAIVFTLPVAP